MQTARNGVRRFEQDALTKAVASAGAAPTGSTPPPGMPRDGESTFTVGRLRFGTPGTAEDRRRHGRRTFLEQIGMRRR